MSGLPRIGVPVVGGMSVNGPLVDAIGESMGGDEDVEEDDDDQAMTMPPRAKPVRFDQDSRTASQISPKLGWGRVRPNP